MKLFLFGGAEGSVQQELNLIEKVIAKLPTKQILHVPFARMKPSSNVEWNGDWFNRNIHVKGLQYLNANKKGDLAKAKNPIVFISGGSNSANLIKKINATPLLLKKIKNAEFLIGESAGSMVLGSVFVSGSKDGKDRRLLKGIGILKSTLILPHYSERNRQTELVKFMNQSKVKYGIGIDACTAMVFNLKDFPRKYKKIGQGKVVMSIST